jgi:CheY-like chemotaxis protein
VFEPFFTTKPNHSGSGLGLSVAQGIVKQSGGALTLRNVEQGGACFEFTLPVGELPGSVISAKPWLGPPVRRARVLVVDDEPMLRKITARMLAARGHEVLEASEGVGALRLLETRRPPLDVLVTDVVMPGMSGPKLADAARALLPSLAVVYMTGYDAGALQAETSAIVIQKPFDPEALCRAIENATGHDSTVPPGLADIEPG